MAPNRGRSTRWCSGAVVLLLIAAAAPARAATSGSIPFSLSGGADPTDAVHVDDDLFVYLNGERIFKDDDRSADVHPPIDFTADIGDTLRIVADDSFGVCRGLSPDLSLHRLDTGGVQYLGGFEPRCGGAGEGTEFYDETFVIGASSQPHEERRFFQFNMCGSEGRASLKSDAIDVCDADEVGDDVLRSIVELQPTVVTLNEVCRWQFDELLSDLGLGAWPMSGQFAATREFVEGSKSTNALCLGAPGDDPRSRDFGSAVLVHGMAEADPSSPYVLERRPHPKGAAHTETRSMVCMIVDLGDVRVRACSLHLATAVKEKDKKQARECGKGLVKTREQIYAVAELANGWVARGDAVVIGGDFNARPCDLDALMQPGDALAEFLERFDDVDPTAEPTHDEGKIDYIFLSVANFFDITGEATRSRHSDHRPLRGSAKVGIIA